MVAHKLSFERQLLTQEALQAEMLVPDMLGVCTLRLAGRS